MPLKTKRGEVKDLFFYYAPEDSVWWGKRI
jgi:hypothetical protein